MNLIAEDPVPTEEQPSSPFAYLFAVLCRVSLCSWCVYRLIRNSINSIDPIISGSKRTDRGCSLSNSLARLDYLIHCHSIEIRGFFPLNTYLSLINV